LAVVAVRILGEEIAGEHPEHGIAAATVTELREEVEQLNRTLIRERNSKPADQNT
jgi:hypothetical protein